MKLYLRRQAIIAWLLLFTITPIGLVKSFHYHDAGEVSTAHHCSGSVCNCDICQFHLFPYIKATVYNLTVHFVVRPYETIIRIFKVVKTTSYSYSLRAPPHLF